MTYFEGFVVPVPEANKEAYRKSAADFAPIFQEFGVKRHIEVGGGSGGTVEPDITPVKAA